MLAENFSLPVSAFKNLAVDNKWIFQGKTPVPSLADAQRSVLGPQGASPIEFTFSTSDMKPTIQTKSGSTKVIDTRNFPVSKTIASALITVKPGGLRELHWHPNADEWQYYIKGMGQMTVFNNGPQAVTADFQAGDIGYIKRASAIMC